MSSRAAISSTGKAEDTATCTFPYCLLVLLARKIFPGVLQKWFALASAAVAAGFASMCLAADTVLLSQVQPYYNGLYAAAVVYLSARFLMKLPKMA